MINAFPMAATALDLPAGQNLAQEIFSSGGNVAEKIVQVKAVKFPPSFRGVPSIKSAFVNRRVFETVLPRQFLLVWRGGSGAQSNL
jgi:hypothetical protein